MDTSDVYCYFFVRINKSVLVSQKILVFCFRFMFDEPSSYLDVKQRLKAARGIRGLLSSQNYVIVVEHDLSVLDYLSDFICCLYGLPGAYGVVTMPFSVREGIFFILTWRRAFSSKIICKIRKTEELEKN